MGFPVETYKPVLNLNLLPALGLREKGEPFLTALVAYERAVADHADTSRAEIDLCILAHRYSNGTGIVIQKGPACYFAGLVQKDEAAETVMETISVISQRENFLSMPTEVQKLSMSNHFFSQYLFQGEPLEKKEQYLRLVYADLARG